MNVHSKGNFYSFAFGMRDRGRVCMIVTFLLRNVMLFIRSQYFHYFVVGARFMTIGSDLCINTGVLNLYAGNLKICNFMSANRSISSSVKMYVCHSTGVCMYHVHGLGIKYSASYFVSSYEQHAFQSVCMYVRVNLSTQVLLHTCFGVLPSASIQKLP